MMIGILSLVFFPSCTVLFSTSLSLLKGINSNYSYLPVDIFSTIPIFFLCNTWGPVCTIHKRGESLLLFFVVLSLIHFILFCSVPGAFSSPGCTSPAPFIWLLKEGEDHQKGSSPLTILTALFWTHSNRFMSSLCWEPRAEGNSAGRISENTGKKNRMVEIKRKFVALMSVCIFFSTILTFYFDFDLYWSKDHVLIPKFS